MNEFLVILSGVLLLVAIAVYFARKDKARSRRDPDPISDDLREASAWDIGPYRRNGVNYSKGYGAPGRPVQDMAGVMIPISPDKEPHYVTFPFGSLEGKREIRMRFRVEADPDVRIHGAGDDQPAHVTLYFEMPNEDGTRNLSQDGYRWWATFATVRPLAGAMEGEIIAPLDGPWTSVQTMTATKNPEYFALAKNKARRVGFTFGNLSGHGHGCLATGPVKFIILDFQVR